jgi:hypothetical protein
VRHRLPSHFTWTIQRTANGPATRHEGTWEQELWIHTRFSIVGLDSSVGIPTRYGTDGPGIESQWGARYSAPVQTGPGTQPASYTVRTGSLSPGVKRLGREVDHPPPSSAEVKERVELYLYSPFWAFIVCPTVNITFTFTRCSIKLRKVRGTEHVPRIAYVRNLQKQDYLEKLKESTE